MLRGLNHITLAVTDLDRSFDFYRSTLGFKPEVRWKQGAYLSLGDLWLCLACERAQPAGDYTHIAFDITRENFSVFTERLLLAGVTKWKENSSEGESLYFLDPDGHKLEIHVGSLTSRIDSLRSKPYEGAIFY